MTLKQDPSINSMVNLTNRNIIRLNIFIHSQDSIVSIVTRLKAWKSGLQILARKERYLLFSVMSRPALGPTQSSTECVPWALSLGIK
jgi:hypothetical protein